MSQIDKDSDQMKFYRNKSGQLFITLNDEIVEGVILSLFLLLF